MGEIFQLGLIGYPVSHSQSPKLFANFFEIDQLENWEYKLFPIETINQLHSFIQSNPNLIGFNVTVPHKQNIIPFLNSISSAAKQIGAVNTVKIIRDGADIFLEGHNTDYHGFMSTLNTLPNAPSHAIVLGNGGSAQAVKASLKEKNIAFSVVSRNPSNSEISYGTLLDMDFPQNTLIINSSPVGMSPNTEAMPIFPYSSINQTMSAIDLIYNPEETLFLKQFKQKGCYIQNGALMLKSQAEKAWQIFKTNENQ